MTVTRILLLFALAMPLAPASSQAGPRCPGENRMRSIAGDIPATITFRAVGENDETQFKIYWLDYDGRRKFYKHLFAGEAYTQQTYMTHPWLVTAPVPGGGEDCIAIYQPKRGGRTVTLR